MLKPTSRRLVATLFLALVAWAPLTGLGFGVLSLLIPQAADAQALTDEQQTAFQRIRAGGLGGWAEAFARRIPGTTTAQFEALGISGGGGGNGGGGGGGLLSGLLGGDGGGILPLLLLILLLMQLFGGGQGGNTPQKDSLVEEQPPIFPPSVGPQQTGPRGGVPPPAPPPAAILPVQPPVSVPLAVPPASLPITLPGQTMTFQIPSGADSGTLSPNTVAIQSGSAITMNNTATVPASITVRRAGQTASLAQVSVAAGTSHRLRFQNAGTFELVSGMKVLGTVTVR
ncbi:MAG: hypothetical protein G01um101438_982 [Parcubacteria group bacterium Gr01-1014_38]|nr:MAG: hypothetical protein G01um101438_982 [Parcubacteria group bacterium Gr01-1014_38]